MDTHRLPGTLDCWWAIQVVAGREAFAADHLRHRGYDVFLPTYREIRRWSDRVKKIDRALFTGYVFCRSMAGGANGRIVTVPGVIRIVGNNEGPLPVPTDEIDAIRRIVESRLLTEPWPYLHAGQRVRIEVGPLQGTEGTVLHAKNTQRLVVSIPLLKRSVAVELDSSWLSIPPGEVLEYACPQVS